MMAKPMPIPQQKITTASFIDFECEKAVRDGLKIVVLYNDTNIYRSMCPESVRYKGTHIAAKNPYTYMWDYDAIKRAIV